MGSINFELVEHQVYANKEHMSRRNACKTQGSLLEQQNCLWFCVRLKSQFNNSPLMCFPRFVEHGSIKPCAVLLVSSVKNINKMEFVKGLLHRDDNCISLSALWLYLIDRV